MKPTKCHKCHNLLNGNYGISIHGKRRKYKCYACCVETEKAFMRKNGKTMLYLSQEQKATPIQRLPYRMEADTCKVTDFTGGLSITPTSVKASFHNIAGKRYDAWFIFEGYFWHGVTYGDNTQILHCKKTKTKFPYS